MTAPRPRILFLAHLLPWPLTGGGQIKSYHALRALSAHYDVTLMAFTRCSDAVEEAVRELGAFCAGGVQTVPLPRGVAWDAHALSRALVNRTPFQVERDAVPAMRQAVERELRAQTYAALHLDHLQMAANLPENKGSDTIPVVLDQHNAEYRVWERLAGTPGASVILRLFAGWEWRRTRAFEQRACVRSQRVLTVSKTDREALVRLDPEALARKTVVVPIAVDSGNRSQSPVRRADATTLLSIGTMYWPPNAEGAVWFCREILPLVRRERPEVRVVLVGARPPRAVQALAELPGVSVMGQVPDVRPLAEDCGVFIVPLRAGSGVRVKILTAFAMGLPVVSTTLGAEGIAVEDGIDLLLADTPEAFAQSVLRVLADPALAARLGENGRAFVQRHHAPEVVGERLREVYEELLAAHTGRGERESVSFS